MRSRALILALIGGCVALVADNCKKSTPPPTSPVVASISPNSGLTSGGTNVTISGSGFDSGSTASLGGVGLSNISASSGTITGTTGAHGAGAVDVVVTHSGGQTGTLAGGFTYNPPPPSAPTISSVNPNNGTVNGGTQITITGTNFITGATASVGGVALSNVAVTSTTITGTTGPTTTAGQVGVSVTSSGQTVTSPNAFTYIAALHAVISGAPTITEHNNPINFSGTTSTTTTPYSINSYKWNCGQDAATYGNGCDVSNALTATFNYRKCSPPSAPVANRQQCQASNPDRRTYTVSLTVGDTQSNTNTTTFNITVTNKY